jgi:AcrR family transcriptional regulator
MMPSSYRRLRLVEPASLIPWSDPGSPSFSKSQQEAILRAALDEFAAHGFHDASLNRVIDAAGSPKGSMYYYFDGKEDLYIHVTRVELERLFAGVGPFPIPTETDPDTFWSTLEGYYLRLRTTLAALPTLAALIRGWLAASNSALEQAKQELEQATLPWGFSARWPPASGRELRAMTCRLVC